VASFSGLVLKVRSRGGVHLRQEIQDIASAGRLSPPAPMPAAFILCKIPLPEVSREGAEMTRILCVSFAAFAFIAHLSTAWAAESKEITKQRQAAQRERQLEKNERAKGINEATRAFREYVRDLKTDYQAQTRELDTEFELRRVELKAEHDASIAGAESEYQAKIMGLFMNPQAEFTEQAIEQMQNEGKAYADAIFALKRQSAEALHRESMALEERKNALLTERDQMAMEEASALGLTASYSPILATPTGDGLTKSEELWNKREKKEVKKLEERNAKTVAEFRNGKKLRDWDIENLNEDFKLTWDEKAEVHALDSQQIFYNALFMQAAQGKQVDQQGYMSKLAELNKQKKLIRIEYKKVRDKNRIKRREEKKKLLAAN